MNPRKTVGVGATAEDEKTDQHEDFFIRTSVFLTFPNFHSFFQGNCYYRLAGVKWGKAKTLIIILLKMQAEAWGETHWLINSEEAPKGRLSSYVHVTFLQER